MKRFVLFFLMTVLALPAGAFAGVIGPARVLLIEGDVVFRTPDSEEWLPASVNTPLDEGDALWAPPGSRTEVQLTNGTVLRLDGDSLIDLIAVEEGFTHLHLARGKLYLRTSPLAGKNSIQVDADDTTVLPEARTRLRIDMLQNSQEDVAIFKGSAYVEGNGNRTKVRAGEHIALEEGHSELLPLNPADSWEKWNVERDRIQSRTATGESNLPEELQAYSSELNSNGRWERVPEYGMVWRPTVILSDDWGPYRNGRWIWKGDDYVWIAYEDWGWAPYHYGRWAVVGSFGWCWVPPARGDIFWGPGYVGWYRTGSHVGWTPLAPGELFYGHKKYGLHSASSATAPINMAGIAYKNRDTRGGFSILLQNDFLRGRAVFQNPANIRAVSVSVSLGSPRIQPLRETRMPIIKQTPPRVAPPATHSRDGQNLRARFPRVAPPVEKQRTTVPHTLTTSPTAPPFVPRPSSPVPSRQHEEGTLRTSPPQPSLNHPRSTSPPSAPGQVDKHQAPSASTSNRETPGQGIRQREQQQKKVWRVITTELGNEKDMKEKDNKEHKGRK